MTDRPAPAVYLAARYSRREELCVYREQLRAVGFDVTSRWLDGEHQVSNEQLASNPEVDPIDGTGSHDVETRARFAAEDWLDLQRADICIAFTEAPRSSNSRGGRHVELGAALAWGHDVHIVGPLENVFCCLPQIVSVHDAWPMAFARVAFTMVDWSRYAWKRPRDRDGLPAVSPP